MNTLKNLFFLIFVSTIDSKPQLNNFLIGTSCVTRANEIGNCQYYENCPHLVEKLQNHQINQEDIFKCNSQGIICCTPDISTTTISTTTKSVISSDEDFESRAGIIRRIPGKISEEKCREYSKYTKSIITISGTLSNPKPTTMVNDKCQHKSTQLIVGGTTAHQHEFPHQAHLGYIISRNKTEWACGGSLVSENYVLTAAHCRGSKSLDKVKFVKLGMIDRSQNDYNILYYKVIEIIEHPDYNPKSFENDIALLKLNRKVNFNQFIYPICLPTKQHDESKAVATGLGRISGFEDQSNNLLKVELEKFSNEECQRIINTKTITENMLCYGSHTEKKDSCGGDSGGPLQILNDEEAYCTYKLIGVVSLGNANCGMAGFPGVYVNVFKYLSWIEDIVWNNTK